jgi:hypothetical protein
MRGDAKWKSVTERHCLYSIGWVGNRCPPHLFLEKAGGAPLRDCDLFLPVIAFAAAPETTMELLYLIAAIMQLRSSRQVMYSYGWN